ncbi:MAG: nitrilase-related carbon-nitrogen hydrolase [Anaerolineae bacterium]|nr:hypothetical protein [Anaerolineae bacterium]
MTTARPDSVRVGMVQFAASNDKHMNIEKALWMADEAADQGAQIVAFHEMFMLPWLFAETVTHPDTSDRLDGAVWERFRELAQRRKLVLVCPFHEDAGDGHYYNTTLVIDADGSNAGHYRKHHLPPDNERCHFSLGTDPIRGMDTQYGRIGVYICWDNFVPEGVRALALDGANIVFSPSAATDYPNRYRWEIALRANALTNSLYCVRLNRIEPPCYGQSFIASPNGDYVVPPTKAVETVIVALLDLTMIEKERREWTYLADRRPDQYAVLTQA